MSMPKIPDIKPDICLCSKDIKNLLLASIALQEVALSNVINAEAEKLQTILNKKERCVSIKDLLRLNVTIEKVLEEVSSIETLLISKLKYISQIYNDNSIYDYEESECDCRKNECSEENDDIYNECSVCEQDNQKKDYNNISNIINKIIHKNTDKSE
jgi:hypothetical protein